MNKTYISAIAYRAPKARSKRLRDIGIGASSASVLVSGSAGGSAVTSPESGHTHSNLAMLEQISTDDDGYLWLSETHDAVDGDESTEETTTEKVKAGYADLAFDLAEDSPARELFLSRLADDVAHGNITFEQMISVLGAAALKGGATFGEFDAGQFTGHGGRIDALGNAEVESIIVRSSMRVAELIINRITAMEGDTLLTEADAIESVTEDSEGVYTLTLKRKWDGYFTGITPGSVLRGIYNSLAKRALELGHAEGSESTADYFTSWMLVRSVNPAANTITVVMYPDEDCPSGQNYAPVPLMNVARWGHQTDTSRQQLLYLSSIEGAIRKLKGVYQPKIDDTNTAFHVGTIPQSLYDYLTEIGHTVSPTDEVVYADKLFARHFIQVPERDADWEIVYREYDHWEADGVYRYKSPNMDINPYKWEVSRVWHYGCLWECRKDLTTSEPRWDSTDWAFLQGDPSFVIDFLEDDQLYDYSEPDIRLTLVGTYHGQDVTADILPSDVVWTRTTEGGDPMERQWSDSSWTADFAQRIALGDADPKAVRFNAADCGITGSFRPTRTTFTCTATLRDGMVATIEYTL